MAEQPDHTIKAARHVADELDRQGHAHHASAFRDALTRTHPFSVLLAALRETCQVALTAIEAIDPVSATLIEELRLEVDKRLSEEHTRKAGA
jgi:hypothetical protein